MEQAILFIRPYVICMHLYVDVIPLKVSDVYWGERLPFCHMVVKVTSSSIL